MWKRLLAMLFAAALIAAACGDSDDAESGGDDSANTTTGGDDGATTTTDDANAADLQLASADLGEILVDAEGVTVYLFVPDSQGESTCYDECEANWPFVGELATVVDGLDASLLGTTERTTGDLQATYNGWPLYYLANDAAPGDVNGQGVRDVWYVLDTRGDAIGAG
jgi:predicted lipoprotein with Yx(FWY)xxD motif